jgi:NADH dehydrogenase FAD-containing subunit
VPLVEGMAVALDTAARVVHLADGRTAEYDVLSLDTGASMDRDRIRGARDNALFVRPIEHFVRLLDGLVALARSVWSMWWWWAAARPVSNWRWPAVPPGRPG